MSAQYEDRLLIDGELVAATGGGRYDNFNPADSSVIGQAADGQPEDMTRAIGAARRAFDETDWSQDHEFRKRCLVQLQTVLRARNDRFRDIHIAEAGQVFTTASGVTSIIDGMSYEIGLLDSYEFERSFGTKNVMGADQERLVRMEPYGVAGLISPWNAPFLSNVWKLAPALAAGNTVVLKAAPATPFTATEIARAIVEETDIPAGVVNIITSADKAAVGETLTGDQRVDMYHFTGSPVTGARVMERAAAGLRKVVFELGGKSANILLDDADLESAIPFSAILSCLLSGQGCALPTRVLAPPNLYDVVVDRLKAIFETLPVGDPRDPSTVIGPIINASQHQRVLGLIDAGIAEGSRLILGGKVPKMEGALERGFWVEPTIFIDVDPAGTIGQTEIFGPVLSVYRYEDDDDAVQIANATPFGLAGFVQSADTERAVRVARRLRAGSIGLNGTATWVHDDIPFGGYGISGLGREHGIEGFEEYLQSKAITYPA